MGGTNGTITNQMEHSEQTRKNRHDGIALALKYTVDHNMLQYSLLSEVDIALASEYTVEP